MINFELAKELRDAGYPQKLRMGGRLVHRDGEGLFVLDINDLITRLGSIPLSLTPMFFKSRLLGEDLTGEVWHVHSHKHEGNGKTREEALARLWIEIQRSEPIE